MKPKVAILAPRYGIYERGVEVFTKEFVAHLAKDFEFTVFSRGNTFAFSESTKAFKLIPKFLSKYYLSAVDLEMLTFSLFCLPKLLFGKFDLIFPQNGVWGAIVCRFVRFLTKTPYIYRSAGGFEPQIVRQGPDLYVATTPETAQKIKKYRSTQKIVRIPNGVDLKKFKVNGPKFKLSLEKPVFVCVAALESQKRVDLAITAVSKLKRGSLLVLGEGPLKQDLVGLGKKLLGKRFMVLNVSNNQMPSYLGACDVFTLPSVGEPFGIAYLEAMACGLPIVAPSDANRKYIIGPAGKLCDVENIREYSKTLQLAARRNVWGDLPQKQAMKFSWNKISNEYRAKIRALIQK